VEWELPVGYGVSEKRISMPGDLCPVVELERNVTGVQYISPGEQAEEVESNQSKPGQGPAGGCLLRQKEACQARVKQPSCPMGSSPET
jgi:hypothetical protein